MLPERLKALRKERDVTQRAVAIATNITDRSYQRFESGESKPNYETLLALANYFNVTVDYLMGRVKNPNAFYVALDDLDERTDIPDDALVESGFRITLTEKQKKVIDEDLKAILDKMQELGISYEIIVGRTDKPEVNR
jgi:transcriptional regulator with XRE-family HTH domain